MCPISLFVVRLGCVSFLLLNSVFGQNPSGSPAPTAAKSLDSPATGTLPPPCAPRVDVCDLLGRYALLTRLKVIRDDSAQGQVSIDDVAGPAPEKAIQIMERSLFANGFTITDIDAETIEVSGMRKNPRAIGIPVVSDAKDLPKRERLVSFVLVFKHQNAEELQQALGQYLSPPQAYTSLLAMSKTNMLLITDRTSVVRRLIEIAAHMDVPNAKKEP